LVAGSLNPAGVGRLRPRKRRTGQKVCSAWTCRDPAEGREKPSGRIAQPQQARKGLPVSPSGDGAKLRKTSSRRVAGCLLLLPGETTVPPGPWKLGRPPVAHTR